MTDRRPDRTERIRAVAAISVSLAMASLIHGMTLPLLSLILERHGVDETTIGINVTAQYLTVFVAAPFVTPFLRRYGPATMIFWSLIASVGVFIALPVYVDVYVWFALRLILGIALSFLWIAGEAWVCHIAEERSLGRTVAVYATVISIGFGLGPALLAWIGTEGWTPFLACAGFMAAAAVPMAWFRRGAPRLEGRPSGSLLRFVALAPVMMTVYLVFSGADAVMLTFLPIYGSGAGLAEWQAISLLSVLALGVVLSQPPIGWLTDHMSGMLLMFIMVALMALCTATLPLGIAHTPWNIVIMLGFGAAMGGVYTVSLAMMGRRFKGPDLGRAATVRSILFCVGALIAPPISGISIDWFGPNGLPISLTVMLLLVLPLPLIGILRKWIA